MASSLCFLPFLLFVLSSVVSPSSADVLHGNEEAEAVKNDLYREYLREEAVSRLSELGKVSDVEGYLERTFMSPASIKAGNIIRQWMEDAGLRTWVDHMGNVHGRVDGMDASSAALLMGSHYDTVVDAGRFDGALGIVSAISALKALKVSGKLEKLNRPVEVIAFSDEEGVRFQTTFLGSAAIAGKLPASTLNISDRSGRSLQDVLKENSVDAIEENLIQLKYEPESVWGYVEVHIEQGPVLESAGLPLGVVKGIAGQTRLKVTVSGSQGHAGTVPMSMRRDPMAAAAELIVLLDSLCKHPQDFLSYDDQCSTVESLFGSLVCTVGEISLWPSASNVIPGQVTFTIDLRAMDDVGREAVLYELSNRMYSICDKRSVSCVIERKHDAKAVNCDKELSMQLKSAALLAFKKMAGNVEVEVPKLMSGAGHDAMAMAHLCKIGMLFVRCRGGISHSPAEHVLDDDVWAAGLAVLAFLENQI
uniref:allantoate deiminase n=1 Tax=Opuntia streptacantha TaxID=393608 RepID=A0A7C8ZXM5_OPUST